MYNLIKTLLTSNTNPILVINERKAPKNNLGAYRWHEGKAGGEVWINILNIEEVAHHNQLDVKEIALWALNHECWHYIQHVRGKGTVEVSKEMEEAGASWGSRGGLDTLGGETPYALKSVYEFEAELCTQLSVGSESLLFTTIMWGKGVRRWTPMVVPEDWEEMSRLHKKLVDRFWPMVRDVLTERKFLKAVS